MTTDRIVTFAQARFGTDEGIPPGILVRKQPPEWLGSASAENTLSFEGDHALRVEGEITSTFVDTYADTTTPDALAYYLPFHFYRRSWGIYVRAAGVWALAERLCLPNRSPSTAMLDFSFKLLLEHERFHFFSEYAASRLEVVSAEPSYTEYFKHTEAAFHEEALANAHSIKVLRPRVVHHFAASAEAWMLTQPPGYREFNRWLPPHFAEGQRRAAGFMSMVSEARNVLINNSHPAEFLFFQINPRRSPVKILLETNTPWLKVARPFPKQFGLQVHIHLNDHKPPHIHIDCPPGTPYTRYLWPSLTPFPKDPPLGSSENKALRRYIEIHGSAIGRKIAAVPWQ